MAKQAENWKVVAVSGGFYFYGAEVTGPDGYIALEKAAMFGGFSGGKGVPGVCRGDKEAKVTLDRFDENEQIIFPISAVFAIMSSVDLYSRKTTTLR